MKKTTIQYSAVLCRSWLWATGFTLIIEKTLLLKNNYYYPTKTSCVEYRVKNHNGSGFTEWFCGSRAESTSSPLSGVSGLKKLVLLGMETGCSSPSAKAGVKGPWSKRINWCLAQRGGRLFQISSLFQWTIYRATCQER